MARNPVDDFVEGTERMEETSLMDLPDEMLTEIISDCDLPSQFKMRVNKRLKQLQHCHSLRVKNNLKQIVLNMYSNDYDMYVRTSARTYYHNSRDFNQLEQVIRRLALSSSVDEITVDFPRMLTVDEKHSRAIEAVFICEADKLYVTSPIDFNLPQVNLSSLFALAQNVKYVTIICMCNSLTGQDLSTLRKRMLKGECKLETFDVLVEKRLYTSFVESCFGVIIEEAVEPRRITIIYRAVDESVEFYSMFEPPNNFEELRHMEGCFGTRVNSHGSSEDSSYQIVFDKSGRETHPNSFGPLHKIMLNHLYSTR